ncbi:uncharacterized protein LOC121942495 [Plectropomus leopardus]|uniref:uncharacterized protein LOC121942495 n=1 Tax=Plectropomus leopardus TaxID=160734 RepID=UPI001C4D66D2|nr:uncharacterized protein LOC121942495 [Plectropomus leopardus]
MSGTQLLRLRMKERLSAAAEEIFGLVEKTIAEYQDEAVRSKREVIELRQQIEQLAFLKPAVVLFKADTVLIPEEPPASLQQSVIKMEEIPVQEQTQIQEHPQPYPQVKEERVDQWISHNMEAGTSNECRAKREINLLKRRIEQRTVLTDGVTLFGPETPQRGHGPSGDGPLSASPATDDKKLLTMMSELIHHLTQFTAEVKPQLTAMNTKLLSIQGRITAVEANVNCSTSVEEIKRKKRAHNCKIEETVRRLHNSEANWKRYKPEQGLYSAHNKAVTSYLVKAVAASSDLYNMDNDAILSACRDYYETLCRNLRYSQPPDLAAQAAAMKYSAVSRQRRKRLLEARQSVLAPNEMDFWSGITMDMMSDEEDGCFGGVSGFIVRPPSFRSQELSDLCATLQKRLEASPKYTATHPKRLRIGPPSDRMPLNSYDKDAAKRHFKAHLMPQVLL